MASFLIGLFTVVLVLASLFMVFIVLMQRGSSQGGAGAAFGGGMAESAFGGETNKVLTRATVITAIIFFVVGLGLYLGQIATHKPRRSGNVALESVITQAESQAKAAQQSETPAAAPKIGDATAEAMQVLEAEAPAAPIDETPSQPSNN